MELCRPDTLAIGIGNAHGYYRGKPEIHLDVLEAVRRFTDIPLVLHGCTGMEESVVRAAIQLGVAKINFGTEIRYKYVQHYQEALGRWTTRPFLEAEPGGQRRAGRGHQRHHPPVRLCGHGVKAHPGCPPQVFAAGAGRFERKRESAIKKNN